VYTIKKSSTNSHIDNNLQILNNTAIKDQPRNVLETPMPIFMGPKKQPEVSLGVGERSPNKTSTSSELRKLKE
jgi:hypothetical protein